MYHSLLRVLPCFKILPFSSLVTKNPCSHLMHVVQMCITYVYLILLHFPFWAISLNLMHTYFWLWSHILFSNFIPKLVLSPHLMYIFLSSTCFVSYCPYAIKWLPPRVRSGSNVCNDTTLTYCRKHHMVLIETYYH